MNGSISDILKLLVLIYLIVQLAGIGYIIIGLVNFRSYLLGYVTGVLFALLTIIIAALTMGRRGEDFLEALFSRLL